YFPFMANGPIMRIEVLKILDMVSNPSDPNALIEDLARLLFPLPISEERRDMLKEILIPGLPDFEWTDEYGEYLANPGNNGLANAIDAKLRNLVRAMLTMPDFFLQ
ncbi:hypothetical protein RZS08_20715, partial [Arthrospira platensis SPKY1]|nr:hypothetical protein [Arthrospira platensis SPKY1]